MARCVWTIALCFLAAGVATAQAPGDEAPGDNVGRAAERQQRRTTRQSPADEEPAADADGERRRGADGDRRRGRDEEGEAGRFGGEGRFRRANPMFEALDADGDQSISTAELRKAIAALKKLDADGDGLITLDEASPRGPGGIGGPGGPFGGGNPGQFVDSIMQRNDRNGDGRLTLDEMTDERMAMMLANADTNNDRAIDRAELEAAMTQMRGGPGFGGGPGGGFGGRGFDARQMTERMMANDRNGDGKLSPDEVPEQGRGMLQGGDLDQDGFIDAAEMEQITRRMGERFGGGRGFGGDRGDRGSRGSRDADEGDEEGEGGRRSRRQRPEAEE